MNSNEVISIPSLPLQSAVYVLIDPIGKQVHLLTRDVPSRYGLANGQLADRDHFMNAEETEQLLQLTSDRRWKGGEDRAGFFNGSPATDIWQSLMVRSNRRLELVMETINPYEELIVDDGYTRTLFNPPMPETESNHGVLTYFNSNNLRVYTPQIDDNLDYLLFKIDVPGYIDEVALANGSYIGELPISRELAQTYRDQIRDNSLDIIRNAAMHDNNKHSLDSSKKQIMASEDIRTWNRVVHRHLTVSDYYLSASSLGLRRLSRRMSASLERLRRLSRRVKLRRNCCNSHLPLGKDAESTLERYKFYDQCNRAGVNARNIKNETGLLLRELMDLSARRNSETNLWVRRDIKRMEEALGKYINEYNAMISEINDFSFINDKKECWGCEWLDSNY